MVLTATKVPVLLYSKLSSTAFRWFLDLKELMLLYILLHSTRSTKKRILCQTCHCVTFIKEYHTM